MNTRKIRNYEISIWTLQDTFISVLKPATIENKGQIQDGKFKNCVDGTQELKFTIPMYINSNTINPRWYNTDNQLLKNPIWENAVNGNLIADLRKIKLIINKATSREAIYELIIVNVTERHEQEQLYCDVECEGLAFHELGKIGYKVSLTSDDFNNDYYKWMDDEQSTAATEPIANINYWTDKFLTNVNNAKPEELADYNTWLYDVQMDWSSYSHSSERATNRIYEEDYVSAWNVDSTTFNLVPTAIESYREKARMVELEESNKYNLTQDLAKAFEVYCKYEYLHDDNYHIVGRRVIYYNNYLLEQGDGAFLDITYPYSTNQVSRKMEGKDLVTKMYVRPLDLDINDITTQATIMDVEANPSGEDYLLNFDYLYTIGAISQDQYDLIKVYEGKMRLLNSSLRTYSDKLATYSNTQNEWAAKRDNLSASITEAQNQADEAKNSLNNLTNNGIIEHGNSNPDRGVLKLLNTSNNNTQGIYQLKLSQNGIKFNTLKLYRTVQYANGTAKYEYKNGIDLSKVTPIYEDNNLTRIDNICLNFTDETLSVYMLYQANVQEYYSNIINIYLQRVASDQVAYNEAVAKYNAITTSLNEIQDEYNNIIEEQQALRAEFERAMGPALREGYWQPEDIADVGDKYIDQFNNINSISTINGSTPYVTWIWDEEAFANEDKLTYESGIGGTPETRLRYYPYLWIRNSAALKYIYDNLDNDLYFSYYSYNWGADASLNKKKMIRLNTQSALAMIKRTAASTTALHLGIILTDLANETDDVIQSIVNGDSYVQANISIITHTISSNGVTYTEQASGLTFSINNNNADIVLWTPGYKKNNVNVDVATSTIVYPRICIDSTHLKTAEDQLTVKFHQTVLKEYEDFSILTREGKYYITLKPLSMLKYMRGAASSPSILNSSVEIKYCLSNADTAVYLDAIQVLKESAWPRVSYEVKIDAVNPKFLESDYLQLNRLVHINDNQLKFKNVQGYIYSYELDLDKPWEDTIEVKNYKTKFEDLFTTIVATTEQMKKNEYIVGLAAQAFTTSGNLTSEIIENTMRHVNLNYAFNDGHLTINEENGIWGVSSAGVVCFRGGGIFTSTTQDDEGNWIWNTGILPTGVNADLITSGQLDTNKINIFAGDELRFQWNANGIFAFHNAIEDFKKANADNKKIWVYENGTYDGSTISSNNVNDTNNYLQMNSNGLFLVAKAGGKVLYPATTDINTNVKQGDYIYKTLVQDINRVEISWDGLKLHNYNGQETFGADAETGNLTIAGTLYANGGVLGGVQIDSARGIDFGWIIDTGILYSGTNSSEIANKLVTNTNITNISNSNGIFLRSGTHSGSTWKYQPGIFMYDTAQLLFGAYTDKNNKYKIEMRLPNEDSLLDITGGGQINIETTMFNLFAGDREQGGISLEILNDANGRKYGRITTSSLNSINAEVEDTLTVQNLIVKNLEITNAAPEEISYKPVWKGSTRTIRSSEMSLADFIIQAESYIYDGLEYILDYHLLNFGTATGSMPPYVSGHIRTDTTNDIYIFRNVNCQRLYIHSDVYGSDDTGTPSEFRACPPLHFKHCTGQITLHHLWFNPGITTNGTTNYSIKLDNLTGKCVVVNCWVAAADYGIVSTHADFAWINSMSQGDLLNISNYPTTCKVLFGKAARGSFGTLWGKVPQFTSSNGPIYIQGSFVDTTHYTGIIGETPVVPEPDTPSSGEVDPGGEDTNPVTEPKIIDLVIGARFSGSTRIRTDTYSQGLYGTRNNTQARSCCLKFDETQITNRTHIESISLIITPKGNSGTGSTFSTNIYAGNALWADYSKDTTTSLHTLLVSKGQQTIDGLKTLILQAISNGSDYLILDPGDTINENLDKSTGLYYSNNYKAFEKASLYITYNG